MIFIHGGIHALCDQIFCYKAVIVITLWSSLISLTPNCFVAFLQHWAMAW